MLNGKAMWDKLKENYNSGSHDWVETTEETYTEQLEVLPPAAQRANAFLMGEPYTYNAAHEKVYACFNKRGKQYFAKFMTIAQFRKLA